MRRLTPLLLTLVVLAACAQPSTQLTRPAVTIRAPHPDERCRPTDVQQAERLVRLHSQLMITALSCQAYAGPLNLRERYADFSSGQSARLADAERRLIDDLASGFGSSAERRFHTWRTETANVTAERAARLGYDTFCAYTLPLMVKLGEATDPSVNPLGLLVDPVAAGAPTCPATDWVDVPGIRMATAG